MKEYKTSKIVYLRRTYTFMDDVQKEAQEFMSMSRKAIGSYWKSQSSKAIGTGLDYNEQQVILPLVVDCEPTDRDFRDRVRNFYKEILTHVEFGKEGTKLEIGLLLDNDKPVTYKDANGLMNIPIEPMDYIRYRHAMEHPQVAKDRQSSLGDPLKLYYIFDPEVENKQQVASTKTADQAMEIYLKLRDDAPKVYDLLLVLGVDPRDFDGPNADVLRAQRLREVAEKQPNDFIKTYKVDNFELRAKINGLLSTNIFTRVGDRIYETSTNTLIAKDLDEAVKVLQDDQFKDKFVIWMGNYQDILAKKKKTTGRKTAAV